VKGPGPLPRKKIIFVPQNDVWVYFYAVFNRQKTRTVTTTRILRFNREMKAYKNRAKIIQTFTVRPKGLAVAPSPPPPNTPLLQRAQTSAKASKVVMLGLLITTV